MSSDYSIFASQDFDPNEYANTILASDTYPPSESRLTVKVPSHLKSSTQDSVAKEDISVAISKLSFGIEDISKQIRNLVRNSLVRLCSHVLIL